jgi:hypothetical protein
MFCPLTVNDVDEPLLVPELLTLLDRAVDASVCGLLITGPSLSGEALLAEELS